MIQMVKGTYGRMANGRVEPMTKNSGPFSLAEAREAELVAARVAVKVDEPDKVKDYNRMKMAELRKAAAAAGVDAAKAKAAKSKKELIDLLEAAEKAPQSSGKE